MAPLAESVIANGNHKAKTRDCLWQPRVDKTTIELFFLAGEPGLLQGVEHVFVIEITRHFK